MPRFAANLSLLFTEWPFLERFDAAARAGFTAVEFQFPYAWPAQVIAERLQAAGVQAVLHNLPAGHWEQGERGIACHPGREEAFRAAVAQAVAYAHTLGVPQLNCLVGLRPREADAALVRSTLVRNLRYGAQVLADAGLRLLIEPLNAYDVPGFYVQSTQEALELLEDVGADNAWLQYDIYHAQRSEGELAATLRQHLGRIGHIQLADNPGRHEPGTGEIRFDYLLAELDRLGYAGWVGCEYHPLRHSLDSLQWCAPWLRPRPSPEKSIDITQILA